MRLVFCLLCCLLACEGPPPTRDFDRNGDSVDMLVSDLDGRALDRDGPEVLADPDSASEMGLLDEGVDAEIDVGPESGPIPTLMDGAVAMDAATVDFGSEPMDASATNNDGASEPDGSTMDAGFEDMSPSMPVDADARPPFVPDAALDARPVDASPFDALPLDGSPEPTAFVSGAARAMDSTVPVRIRAGQRVTQVVDGRYRLGPLPPGRYAMVVEAEGHQSETIVIEVAPDEEVELADETVLFRGQRVAQGGADRFFFRGDGRWLLWVEGEQLFGIDTLDPRPVRYLADGFEVFFGFDSRDVFHLRQRTQDGVAGNILEIALEGGAMETLFVEAQPWLGRVNDRYLAMVETRAAHSRLESRAPGSPPIVLGEGVPWLAVTGMGDDELAWETQLEAGYAVWTGTVDGAVSRRIEPRNIPATDDFLMRIRPSGLAWRGTDGGLWRWGDDTDRLIDDIAPRPLPRFLSIDEVLAWRPAEVGHTVLHHRDGETRVLVSGITTQPFSERRRRVFAHQIGEGLWVGSLDGPHPGVVVPGQLDALVVVDDGVMALINGEVWRWTPASGAVRLAGPGLSGLSYAPGGATAWDVETGRLYYFSSVGMAVVLVADAPVQRPVRASGDALYVRGQQTFRHVRLPGGEGVDFDRNVDDLTVLSPEQVLGLDPESTLYSIHGPTGESVGWANGVGRVTKSPNGAWVAYTCERGIFVVSLAP